MTERPVSDIITGHGHRRHLSDLQSLADSIDNVGLLHPIVVTTGGQLIAGRRRLAAVTDILGWETIPVTVLTDMDDADQLLAERDENTERQPLTPTEAESLASALEELLRPLARERMERTQAKPGERIGSAESAEPMPPQPRPREVAARAAGVSHDTISKIRQVKKVAADPATPEPVRRQATNTLDEMDRTGKVSGPHRTFEQAIEDRRPGAAAEREQVRIAHEWSKVAAAAARFNLLDNPEESAAAVESRELSSTVAVLRTALAFAERSQQAATRTPFTVIQGGSAT